MTAIEWYEIEINLLIELYETKQIPQREFITIKHNLFYKAKEMELEQRKEDFRKGWQGNKHKDWNCEFYLIKHFNNDFKTE